MIEPQIVAEYKSNEEFYFACWCEELLQNGYIEFYNYEPKSFLLCDKVVEVCETQLKTKVKIDTFSLLKELRYTPDFFIKWTDKALNIFVSSDNYKAVKYTPFIMNEEMNSYIEVKPTFDKNGTISNTVVKIKMLYNKHNVFTNLVQIGTAKKKDFFTKTFLPERAAYTVPKGKTKMRLRTKDSKPISNNYLNFEQYRDQLVETIEKVTKGEKLAKLKFRG